MSRNGHHVDRRRSLHTSSSGCDECSASGNHTIEHIFGSAHPVIRRYEPGEDRCRREIDELAFELEGAPPAPSYP